MAYAFTTFTDGLGHARAAQAMRDGQERFETAPALPDDDQMTADEAQEQAEAELLTTAEPLADWIAKGCACDAGRAPVDLLAMRRAEPDLSVDLSDCDSVPVLMAAIFGGFHCEQRAAIERLRALYLRTERAAVTARAAQLLSGGAS